MVNKVVPNEYQRREEPKTKTKWVNNFEETQPEIIRNSIEMVILVI